MLCENVCTRPWVMCYVHYCTAKKIKGNNAEEIIGNALATVTHTLRTAISRSLNFNSPGELAFKRHMFLNLPLQADLQALQNHRQLKVDKNLVDANNR